MDFQPLVWLFNNHSRFYVCSALAVLSFVPGKKTSLRRVFQLFIMLRKFSKIAKFHPFYQQVDNNLHDKYCKNWFTPISTIHVLQCLKFKKNLDSEFSVLLHIIKTVRLFLYCSGFMSPAQQFYIASFIISLFYLVLLLNTSYYIISFNKH